MVGDGLLGGGSFGGEMVEGSLRGVHVGQMDMCGGSMDGGSQEGGSQGETSSFTNVLSSQTMESCPSPCPSPSPADSIHPPSEGVNADTLSLSCQQDNHYQHHPIQADGGGEVSEDRVRGGSVVFGCGSGCGCDGGGDVETGVKDGRIVGVGAGGEVNVGAMTGKGKGTEIRLELLSGYYDSLAVCVLGPQGTCPQTLATFPLDKLPWLPGY